MNTKSICWVLSFLISWIACAQGRQEQNEGERPSQFGVFGGPLFGRVQTVVNERSGSGYLSGLREPDAGAFWLGFYLKEPIDADFDLKFQLTFARTRELVGRPDGGAGGAWVLNNSGFSFMSVPVREDVYFLVHSFGFSLGIEYKVLNESGISLWAGVLPALYYGLISYTNARETGEYGSTSPTTAIGFNLAGGVDFDFAGLILTIFIEAGQSLHEYEVKDLFYDGWNVNSEIPSQGDLRLGIGIAF